MVTLSLIHIKLCIRDSPNGAVLVANTARPLQDGPAALVSAGYITTPATALVELWIEQVGRKAFPPMTAQQILASAA